MFFSWYPDSELAIMGVQIMNLLWMSLGPRKAIVSMWYGPVMKRFSQCELINSCKYWRFYSWQAAKLHYESRAPSASHLPVVSAGHRHWHLPDLLSGTRLTTCNYWNLFIIHLDATPPSEYRLVADARKQIRQILLLSFFPYPFLFSVCFGLFLVWA